MPWPKGKSRKGYVRKDGQPHGKWGQTLSPQVAVRIQALRDRMSSGDTGTSPTQPIRPTQQSGTVSGTNEELDLSVHTLPALSSYSGH